MDSCSREISFDDGPPDAKRQSRKNFHYYEEAKKPAVCCYNGEMSENDEFIQIFENCQCGDGKYSTCRGRKKFPDPLLDSLTRGFIEILSRLWRIGYAVPSPRGAGLSRRKSYGISLLYVIMMTSSLSSANYYSDYVSLYMKNYSKSACDGEYLRIVCPEGTSIDVQGAMYGRKVPSREMCPSRERVEGSGVEKSEVKENTNCEAKTGAECQDQRICRLLVHARVFGRDPCPGTSKYLTVQYQCTPKDFQEQSDCVGTKVLLRCRQDTVISVYNAISQNQDGCGDINKTDCSMTEKDVFDEVSAKCHSKRRCYYTLPTASCFNRVVIVHTCVPKQFLTSELPKSERLYTTTTTTTTTTSPTTIRITTDTAETTDYSTRREASFTTVQSTVNTENKGDPSRNSTYTSKLFATLSTTARNRSQRIQGNFAATATTALQAISYTSFQVSTGATKASVPDDEVLIHNEFPMIPERSMGNERNATQCPNCTEVNIASAGGVYNVLMRIYTFFQENRDDILIAVLLGLVVALLLVICILVFRRKKKAGEPKERRETEETREDNRDSHEENYILAETEAPNQEDEHENMSQLGSLLQRSMDSNHLSPRSKVNPESDVEEEEEFCGPNSIFAKICCNCCCNNAPWQRPRTLRHKGDVYKVTHRSSSSVEDENGSGRYRSHEAFPVFSRTDDDVDIQSPMPVLEDHVNRTEYPIVTSGSVTSPNITSRQNSDFRPISRNAQRQCSVTPEPDSQYRIQRSTFHPHEIRETQRSDPALNRYNVRSQHNATQPLTAPTSPVINHHGNGNHVPVNGTHKMIRAYPASTPKTLPVMGQSMLQTQHQSQTPQSPITPKYTPPPSQYYSTQQYPTFTDAIEQYDNAMPQQKQMVVRRKQFPQRTPQEYHTQGSQYPYPRYNGHYLGFHHQNSHEGDHFVQAVPRRTLSSTARAVELPANSRTVDLSHDNSLSRNSWLEIRRSSIYDNSLPRNSEMYEFYQQQLYQQEMQHALQLELPGSRNLNHYYP